MGEVLDGLKHASPKRRTPFAILTEERPILSACGGKPRLPCSCGAKARSLPTRARGKRPEGPWAPASRGRCSRRRHGSGAGRWRQARDSFGSTFHVVIVLVSVEVG